MSVLDKGISAIFRYLSFLTWTKGCLSSLVWSLLQSASYSASLHLVMPAVASVLGAAVVAMGMRVVVAVAGLLGAAVVAIGTRVEVAVAAVLGAAVSLDCW